MKSIGTTLVSNAQSHMTNSQAQVTLGVTIQNDSITFMSPAKAHLLALAYQNGTAYNTDKSIALVNLNLNALNSTSASSNLTSSGNATQFTTLEAQPFKMILWRKRSCKRFRSQRDK